MPSQTKVNIGSIQLTMALKTLNVIYNFYEWDVRVTKASSTDTSNGAWKWGRFL